MAATISRRRAAALALVASLVLAGCGGGGDDDGPKASPSPSPSSTVKVPEEVSLTDVGKDQSFGDTATVIYEANQNKGSVLELTVTAVSLGSVKDFSGFILDDYTKSATPYYAAVTVKNVGEGEIGNSAIPLWGVDATNTLLPAATFTTTFAKCPSKPLPRVFGPGAVFKTCLVFLAPDKGKLEAVSFRPNQDFDPIQWTGEIATPAPAPAKKPKKP